MYRLSGIRPTQSSAAKLMIHRLTGYQASGTLRRRSNVLRNSFHRGSMAKMRDIAERANTSIGTVSMVLNGREGRIRVSERTRRAVLDAADALGYTPNLAARRLRATISR